MCLWCWRKSNFLMKFRMHIVHILIKSFGNILLQINYMHIITNLTILDWNMQNPCSSMGPKVRLAKALFKKKEIAYIECHCVLSNRHGIWRCHKGCSQVLLLWSDHLWMETQWRPMGAPFINLWFSLKVERRRVHTKSSLWLLFQSEYSVVWFCC